MDKIEITNADKVLNVNSACLDDSTFTNVSLSKVLLENVALVDTKITDANLSGLEIDGAQWGGAYFHNIGLPPEGHPAYDPEAEQKALRFEDCDLHNSLIEDCNLSGIEIVNCTTTGMKINGVLISELFKAYESSRRSFQLSSGL